MSDEEIAEQYAEVNKCVYQNTFVDYSDDYEEMKHAVLYGLAKGKEEKYNLALSQIRHDREKVIEHNERLQKEIAELKSKNKKLYKTLDHLREAKNRKQKRIEVLQEGDTARFEVWHNRLTELEKENAALKETLKWIDNNCANGISTFNEHGLNAGQVVTILQDIHATILEKEITKW